MTCGVGDCAAPLRPRCAPLSRCDEVTEDVVGVGSRHKGSGMSDEPLTEATCVHMQSQARKRHGVMCQKSVVQMLNSVTCSKDRRSACVVSTENPTCKQVARMKFGALAGLQRSSHIYLALLNGVGSAK